MDRRNKRFMGPVAGVTAALGVMMGSGYVALSTDAFIDVGEVTQLAGADTSIYNQQDMRRESQQYLFGIFQNVEEEKLEEDNSSANGTADSTADNTYSGDSVYDVSVIGNTEVYTALVNNGIPDNKAKAMAYAYSATKDLYGKEFAIGLMANVFSEGATGVIEYGKTVNNWDGNGTSKKSYASDPLIVTEAANAQACVDLGVGVSVGLGMCQWSYDRRVTLASLYLSTGQSYSEDVRSNVEIDYMLQEFAGGYNSVVSMCSGATASECAKNICLYYERPSDKQSKAIDRAAVADQIKSYISN